MTRQFAKWYVVIAATLDILVAARSLPAADSTATGREAANTALGRFNTESSFRRNASQPLTAAGTPLYTLDGQQSETVRITAPSSTAFLEILVQPAPAGDLAAVRISEDLDFNGTPDFVYDIPFPVSGICANGIITCTPGTWEDCRPYRWTADDAARVSLDAVQLDNLGGCYCINRSCGSDLVWSNLPVILKDLGGGIAGVIQEKKGNFVITEVRTDGPVISYYGRDTSTGTDMRGNIVSIPTGQSAYYSNPAAMAGATETEVLNQSTAPDSYYAMLGASMNDRGGATQLQSCTITRTATVEQQSRTCPGGEPPDPMNGRCIEWEGEGSSSVPFLFGITFTVQILNDRIRLSVSGNGTGSWVDLRGTGTSQVASMFIELANGQIRHGITGYGTGAWVNLTGSGKSQSTFFGIEVSEGRLRFYNIGGSSGQWVRFLSESDAVCTYDTMDSVNDLCSSMPDDPGCSLQEETVDSVQTFRNFQPTGLVPLPSNRTVAAASACNAGDPPYSTTVTRDWWRKERTYRCTGNTRFDFTDTARRVDTITGSVDGNALDRDRFDFADARRDPDTGAWITDDHVLDVDNTGDSPACELACKTRKTTEDTQAVPAGRTSDARTSNQSVDYLYRICDSDGTCPAGPGETVVKDCQCLDEFAEAASIMSVLTEAGKDMICSDGVRK